MGKLNHVLLTGATGFLGNNLLRMLLEQGVQVSALVRQDPLPESLQNLDFEPIVATLNDSAFVDRCPSRVDAVVHCAAQIQIGRSRLKESRQVNVEATRRLMEYASQTAARFLHVSTVDTLAYSHDGSPKSERDRTPAKPAATYVVTKSEAEKLVFQYAERGLDAVIVHPGFMLGRWDWRPSSAEMMVSVARLQPPVAPAGGASLVHVQDVAQGIINAVERGRTGENYILGGENLSYLKLWQRMAEFAGRRPPRFVLPNWLARTSGRFGDAKAWLTGRESTLNSMATQLGQLNHYYASDKAIAELDYRIRPTDEAIQDCWEWVQERKWVRH